MPRLNEFSNIANARSPRGIVKLSGSIINRDEYGKEIYRNDSAAEVIRGWESWEVNNNAYRSADTFRVVFAVSDLPSSRDEKWFATQSVINIEIFSGFPKDVNKFSSVDLQSLIYGQVDNLRYDPVAGTIELSGRDLTSLFIDTKTSQHFIKKTSSEIAKILAGIHGLDFDVDETKIVVGDYYKDDHQLITQEQSEWDLLTYLANVENFDLYVSGKKLVFKAKVSDKSDAYLIKWQKPNQEIGHAISNAITLEFSRSLTISNGISVEVRSWNSRQKKIFVSSWPKSAKSTAPGQASSRTQVYKFNIPGLTQDAVLQRAQSIYQQIVAHEMQLTAYMPADNVLNCRMPIRVDGTDTSFDQIYYPDSVTRTMSMIEGYRMNIRAKNMSPELKVST